jgi:hypothetical protein
MLHPMSAWTEGLSFAGQIVAVATDQSPVDAPIGRVRDAYGHGPFAVPALHTALAAA